MTYNWLMEERGWSTMGLGFSDFILDKAEVNKVYEFVEASPTDEIVWVFSLLLGNANIADWTVTGVYNVMAILIVSKNKRNEVLTKLKDIGLLLQGGQN